MNFDNTLNANMDVYSISNTFDAMGGATEVRAKSLSGIKCRKRKLKGNESVVAGKEGLEAEYLIYSRPLSGVDETGEIEIDGEVYDILFYDDCNDMEHHAEIWVRRK